MCVRSRRQCPISQVSCRTASASSAGSASSPKNRRDSYRCHAATKLAPSNDSSPTGPKPCSNTWSSAASRTALSADLLATSRTSPELRYPQRARNPSVCVARQHHRYLSRQEGIRLELPHRRPSRRPPRTTDATFARHFSRGVMGYGMLTCEDCGRAGGFPILGQTQNR
jgi:hypothetical protein